MTAMVLILLGLSGTRLSEFLSNVMVSRAACSASLRFSSQPTIRSASSGST